jgi:hypothetical protein
MPLDDHSAKSPSAFVLRLWVLRVALPTAAGIIMLGAIRVPRSALFTRQSLEVALEVLGATALVGYILGLGLWYLGVRPGIK